MITIIVKIIEILLALFKGHIDALGEELIILKKRKEHFESQLKYLQSNEILLNTEIEKAHSKSVDMRYELDKILKEIEEIESRRKSASETVIKTDKEAIRGEL